MSKAEGIQSWEESDFPVLCASCLGDNPAIRMTKECFGQECKVCMKPFTVFRWCPGSGCRYRKTEICSTCSKLKNVCQSCIFDLDYGLPVGVRDAVLQVKQKVPQLEVNRDYFMALSASRLGRNQVGLIDYKQVDPASKHVLEELSRKLNGPKSSDIELETIVEPIKKRNLPPPCSFYAKGSCSRGEYCPYRHELSTERPANLKSYRDRFYGQEDPLAEKLLEKLPEVTAASQSSRLKPEDKSIAAFFLSGITEKHNEDNIRAFFSTHVELKSVKLNGLSALVQFKSRADAEEAAKHFIGLQHLEGVPVKVSWAKIKPKAVKPSFSGEAKGKEAEEGVKTAGIESQEPKPEQNEDVPDVQESEKEIAPEEPKAKKRGRGASKAKDPVQKEPEVQEPKAKRKGRGKNA